MKTGLYHGESENESNSDLEPIAVPPVPPSSQPTPAPVHVETSRGGTQIVDEPPGSIVQASPGAYVKHKDAAGLHDQGPDATRAVNSAVQREFEASRRMPASLAGEREEGGPTPAARLLVAERDAPEGRAALQVLHPPSARSPALSGGRGRSYEGAAASEGSSTRSETPGVPRSAGGARWVKAGGKWVPRASVGDGEGDAPRATPASTAGAVEQVGSPHKRPVVLGLCAVRSLLQGALSLKAGLAVL